MRRSPHVSCLQIYFTVCIYRVHKKNLGKKSFFLFFKGRGGYLSSIATAREQWTTSSKRAQESFSACWDWEASRCTMGYLELGPGRRRIRRGLQEGLRVGPLGHTTSTITPCGLGARAMCRRCMAVFRKDGTHKEKLTICKNNTDSAPRLYKPPPLVSERNGPHCTYRFLCAGGGTGSSGCRRAWAGERCDLGGGVSGAGWRSGCAWGTPILQFTLAAFA